MATPENVIIIIFYDEVTYLQLTINGYMYSFNLGFLQNAEDNEIRWTEKDKIQYSASTFPGAKKSMFSCGIPNSKKKCKKVSVIFAVTVFW